MKETPQQYKKRILGILGRDNPLKIQQATAAKLQVLTRGLSPRQMRRRPSPGKWSITEILAHLADTEIAVGWRLRMILSERGTPIQAFDQDKWAAAGNYRAQNPRHSLAGFKALRERNLRLLKSVPRKKWSHYGMHAERGKETVRRVVEMIAGHDRNHIIQIQGIARQFRGA